MVCYGVLFEKIWSTLDRKVTNRLKDKNPLILVTEYSVQYNKFRVQAGASCRAYLSND
jgi:hypothetical protein